MKAAIYDPYLDILGGGERYIITVANCFSQNGYQVDVFWDDSSIREKLENRFGMKIKNINFLPNIFKKDQRAERKILKEYDVVFFLSDGSVPFLMGKKNFLHFQVPFHAGRGKSLINKIKFRKIKAVVCNSFFTKKFIDQEYGIKSEVLYPPIDVASFKPLKKENIIINVGRFTDLLHQKRQDVLVMVFKNLKKLYPKETEGWRLILAGGDEEGQKLVARLKQMSKDFPIKIITNPRFDSLKEIYGQAKIFWTAAGFGINDEKEPEKVEHFGITTVEAMASGCVPVVINKGGQKEIVEDGKNGFLWETEKQLIDKTLELIENEDEWPKLSKAAQERSLVFSEKKFYERIKKLVG